MIPGILRQTRAEEAHAPIRRGDTPMPEQPLYSVQILGTISEPVPENWRARKVQELALDLGDPARPMKPVQTMLAAPAEPAHNATQSFFAIRQQGDGSVRGASGTPQDRLHLLLGPLVEIANDGEGLPPTTVTFDATRQNLELPPSSGSVLLRFDKGPIDADGKVVGLIGRELRMLHLLAQLIFHGPANGHGSIPRRYCRHSPSLGKQFP
jgi:hypothetical protein